MAETKLSRGQVAAGMSTDFSGTQPIYSLHVQRLILGPLYLGALLTTKREVGLSIGMEF